MIRVPIRGKGVQKSDDLPGTLSHPCGIALPILALLATVIIIAIRGGRTARKGASGRYDYGRLWATLVTGLQLQELQGNCCLRAEWASCLHNGQTRLNNGELGKGG